MSVRALLIRIKKHRGPVLAHYVTPHVRASVGKTDPWELII